MSTYWVLRNGSVECMVADDANPTQPPAATPGRKHRLPAAGQRAWAPAANFQSGLSGLRLTRRGRLFAAWVSLALSIPLVGAGASAAASSPPSAPQLEQYTVSAGESLWTIAERCKAPGTDTRDEVYRIKRLNHLSTSDIFAGQVILVDSVP